MSKICSITVTYNRKELLKKNIGLLLSQTYPLDCIYIIDNCSTDGTYEYMKDIIDTNPQIKYIRLDENLGGSAGFYKGIKCAYEDKMDYLWGMDDDAFPEEDALERLVAEYKNINKECALWSNCIDCKSTQNIEQVESWMFVGFYLPLSLVDKVGFPRNDFFIYHDDAEYSYRIVKHGFPIYRINDSIIHHGDMTARPMHRKKVMGKEIEFPAMPDWKLYYFARNLVLKYKFNDLNKYKMIFSYHPKNIIKLLFLDKHQSRIYMKGYIDGILGVTGKVMAP